MIAAIRERRIPTAATPDETLIYGVVTELQDTKTISQRTYDNALALLGTDQLIELVTSVGFYTTAAMMITPLTPRCRMAADHFHNEMLALKG